MLRHNSRNGFSIQIAAKQTILFTSTQFCVKSNDLETHDFVSNGILWC